MAQQTFRTSLSGFNREDVVRYIEFLNAQHAAEISQLNSELAFLRNKADQEPSAETAAPENGDLIEQQAARIRELFDLCKEQAQQIEKLTAELAQAQQPAPKTCVEDELEAYRRAERIERLAQERAAQMSDRANAVLADATVKIDEAATLIAQMSEKVMGQLTELQTAVSGSNQSLRDAAASLCSIRPDTESK